MYHSDYHQQIDDFEAHYKYDSTYMRELLRYSPEGFVKFDNFMPLANHRSALEPDMFWVAKLAAMQVEDCGECLQLNVRMAIENGISDQIVSATIAGGKTLPETLRNIYDFATCVATGTNPTDELMLHIEEQLGKEAWMELALCIATARVFPSIKRALGYTKSCSLVEITV